MSERPRPLKMTCPPATGSPGPRPRRVPPASDRPDAAHPAPLAAVLASRWAVILKRFRDHMHPR